MLEQIELSGITLAVAVDGLKTVALSNDHGPIDASKPFLAYGSTPTSEQRAGDRLEGGVPEGADQRDRQRDSS